MRREGKHNVRFSDLTKLSFSGGWRTYSQATQVPLPPINKAKGSVGCVVVAGTQKEPQQLTHLVVIFFAGPSMVCFAEALFKVVLEVLEIGAVS